MSQSKQLALQSRQLTKLKQLLKRYRHVKLAQSSLLQLSELASTVSDMNRFYPALTDVIEPLFNTKSFHIVLLNSWAELELAYCNNPDDNIHFAQFNADDWANTLTGKVYSSQKLLQYDAKSQQALAQAGEVTLVGAQSCKTWMGAPLVRGQQVIGVFAIKNYQSTEEDSIRYQQLLSFISDYIVIAIDRVRSRELLELNILQRTKKLTATNQQLQIEIAERQKSENIHKALLHISEITANCDDDYQIFQQIHQIVKTLMFADNFYIALVDNDNEGINFPYYSDEKQTLAQTQKSDIGLTEFIIRLAKPALISGKQVNILHHDGSVEQRAFNERNNKELKVVSWLGAPLIVQDKVIGVIAIQSYRATQNYEKSDIELIRFFSQHIATAIHRNKTALELKRHNEQLEQLVSNRTFELEKSNSNLRLQVEERRRAEERLYFEAHHDALTKLPNRNMFADRLNQAIKHVRRHTTNRFAVLFIDLDRFKLINDTLGHHAGDEFLIEIARRVGHCVRDNDILARLGGDEFVILLDSIQHADDAEEIACRVIEAIQKPFKIQEQTLHSNASIGIAICDKNYRNADELLRDADAAMYQAKAMGRGRYVFFDESMREQLLASMTLEQELRLAVKEQQFELKFQDISDLKHDNIAIGVEAFLRWQHPTQGELAPDQFIAMAEEIGLIIDIEHWVIEQVGQQLARWKTQPQHANSFISINLSGKHIAQPTQLNELVKKIKQCIAEPQRLILEFTERAFSHSSHEQLMHSMRKLKKLGVKLALDDYGSGLSSLNFINNYSFEFIKLDKSFIKTLNTSAKNLALVGSLTQLGNNFGFRIVAEGIENKDVMDKLKSVGCEYGQGYFISTPAHIKQDKSDDDADIASCA